MAPAATVELRLQEPGDCAICADRLRDGLASHRGVVTVEAVPGRESVSVSYDPDLCSLDCLGKAARGLRLDLESAYGHELWKVEGMDCADCAQTIERAVARLDGVTNVAVSFPAATMRLEYLPSAVELGRVRRLVERLGYRVAGSDGDAAEGRGLRRPSREQTTVVSAALLLAALAVDVLTGLAAIPLYAASVLVGGAPLARAGSAALLATRRPDINLLMSVAAAGAMAIGAWLEAALVVVLFSLGELLEGRAVGRARRELAELVSLTPERARVRRRQEHAALPVVDDVEILVSEVAVGDLVVVRPGERIPVDGIVRDGASSVDEAPITGESTPVDKAPGDEVFAGTLNAQGLLLLETTTAPGSTTLDRIARLVAEAQARKSPSERWVDAFARWYTPLVVGAAVLVALAPPLAGVDFSSSFYAALALLIIACPCALVISTPVSIVSALARASSAGVLVKGGAHLEQAALTRVVAFDKTGTLTTGRPRVVAVEPASVVAAEEVLALAASLERGSEHPLARAIVARAEELGLATEPVEGFLALAGLGATGTVGGVAVTIGAPRIFEEPLPDATAASVERLRAQGLTTVVVARDGEPVGVVGLSDTVRDEVPEAVDDLRRLGIEPILLTGDSEEAALAVAAPAGIADVRAALLPHDKVTAVAGLGAGVAMVGDGVNDAPALAAASVGIAMGSAGSDTAIEVADVALLGDDPRKVAGLVGLARWTRAVVRQNVAFSLLTKAAAVALLAFGLLPLWGAVVADVGASLVVIANGLRLVRGVPVGRARSAPLLRPASRR